MGTPAAPPKGLPGLVDTGCPSGQYLQSMVELAPTWPAGSVSPVRGRPRIAWGSWGKGKAGRPSEVQDDQGNPMIPGQILTVEDAVPDSFGLWTVDPRLAEQAVAGRRKCSSAKTSDEGTSFA